MVNLHSLTPGHVLSVEELNLGKESLSAQRKTQGSSWHLERTNKYSVYEFLESSLKDISPKVATQTTT